jgi:hypothetical protein
MAGWDVEDRATWLLLVFSDDRTTTRDASLAQRRKYLRWFSVCLTAFANNKAGYSVAFEEDRGIVHPDERIEDEKIASYEIAAVQRW